MEDDPSVWIEGQAAIDAFGAENDAQMIDRVANYVERDPTDDPVKKSRNRDVAALLRLRAELLRAKEH